jgi:hypothetical protein
MSDASLFFVIVNRGKANDLLHKAQAIGATGGTILLGEGTMQSTFYDLLGINQTHKEVLLMAVPDQVNDQLYNMLREHFKLHKRFRGIAFSVPYRPWRPGDDTPMVSHRHTDAPYLCLFTIVERGLGDECMAIAREAGARGGTIIHAHGAGVPQDFYFPLVIEPQKDMVLIVTPRAGAAAIHKAIFTRMELQKTGKGIIFTLPVLSTVGLYEERRQEVKP